MVMPAFQQSTSFLISGSFNNIFLFCFEKFMILIRLCCRNILPIMAYAVGFLALYHATVTKRRGLLISLVICALPMVPALNIMFPVGTLLAERLLFMPSIGFCIYIADLLSVDLALVWKHLNYRIMALLFPGSPLYTTFAEYLSFETGYTLAKLDIEYVETNFTQSEAIPIDSTNHTKFLNNEKPAVIRTKSSVSCSPKKVITSSSTGNSVKPKVSFSLPESIEAKYVNDSRKNIKETSNIISSDHPSQNCITEEVFVQNSSQVLIQPKKIPVSLFSVVLLPLVCIFTIVIVNRNVDWRNESVCVDLLHIF